MKESAGSEPLLRVALAAVAAADLISLAVFIAAARGDAAAAGVAVPVRLGLLSQPLPVAAVGLVGIAAAITFAARAGRLGAAVVTLASLAWLSSIHTALFGSPWRHLFFSGVCLLGWCAGLLCARRVSNPGDESYARAGAAALLGTAYFSSAVSKIVYGGGEWLSGFPIQSVILGQDGLIPDGVLASYRSLLVTNPSFAMLFSLATVGFELAGPLILLGGRAGRFTALGLMAMHGNIYLLTDIVYWESVTLLALFGVWANHAEAPPPPSEPRSGDRWFYPLVAALLLAIAAAVGHQAWRASHLGGDAEAGSPPPPPATSVPRQIGPFVVGRELLEGWSIDAIDLTDEGFVVRLAGPPGRASFDVSCAFSSYQSPFDLGPLHIFYSSEVAPGVLATPGTAVQNAIRRAAGADVCAQIRQWRSLAAPLDVR